MTEPFRLQVISDLHLDLNRSAAGVAVAPDADVLVVAGDLCQGIVEALTILRDAVARPTPIVFVAGNHEHYGHVVASGLEDGRAAAAERGIAFLEKDAVEIGGVRILGCTLWTDYALSGDDTRPEAMEAAALMMNDHRKIAVRRSPWERFLPKHALGLHRASRAWLAETLAQPFAGPTVVVTHHAPSRRSIQPRYAGHLINGAFASDLDDFVAASGAALWIHGHLHASVDYRLGSTRVVSNPRGYGDENPAFDPRLIVTVSRS